MTKIRISKPTRKFWLLSSALVASLFVLPGGWRWVTASPTPLDIVARVEPVKERKSTPFLRGMTVSCPIYGEIWGRSAMQESLRELRSLGVEWVAIHPYAGVRRDGSIRYQPAAETGYLESAAQFAKAAGIRLFWKPHLAYWGQFEWRGEISFGNSEPAWSRFFDQYEDFIVDQARFAEQMGIELFALGVEYEKTTHRAEWRRILSAVRAVYSGRITYAANWDTLDRVPFWKELDLIGVQAYFPLSELEKPTREDLLKGWEGHLDRLRSFSKRHGKPVLFAEIGYDLASLAAREPWRTRSRETEANRILRQRLIHVALERIEREPWIEGMFWWKWMPGRSSKSRDFPMRHPDAVETLRRAWSTPTVH